jgi:hypothetical protein
MLTIDVMFADEAAFDRVVASDALAPQRIARIYDTDPATVMSVLRDALTVEVSFPRDVPSGSLGDDDVYGCQYMWRLAIAEIDAGAKA